jgi:peptide deformylase
MAIRQIRFKDDEVLRKKARKVDKITSTIKVLLDDMAETMYAEDGVGLAAPQVGILRRVVTIDVGDDNGLLELINPVILSTEGEQINAEGCLSVPGENGFVKRPEKVKVSFMDREGDEYEIEAEGLLAIALCHEIDHLNGILYTDKKITDPEELKKLESQE